MILLISSSAVLKVFPFFGTRTRSGLKVLISDTDNFAKPLNTDSTITSAAVTIITARADISEMILMILCDFLARR